jgi:hypothetical protein
LFPDFLNSSLGIRGAEIIAAIVAFVGMLLTIATLPEPRGKTLEQLEEEALAPAPAPARQRVQTAPSTGS